MRDHRRARQLYFLVAPSALRSRNFVSAFPGGFRFRGRRSETELLIAPTSRSVRGLCMIRLLLPGRWHPGADKDAELMTVWLAS